MRMFIHLLSGLDVVVEDDQLGGVYAAVPSLPGCGSQGDDMYDALMNLDDAIMAVLEILREDEPDRLQRLCGTLTHSSPVGEDDGWDSTDDLLGIVEAGAS